MHSLSRYILGWGLIFSLTVPISPLLAFDPDYIISDDEIADYTAMSLGDIQTFLQKQTGVLDSYMTIDRDGNLRSASDIIYLAAFNHKISPRFLLALLQKEQSLVSDPTPKQGQLDWAMGYAACDSCDVSHPNVARFKGFPKQVNSAAAQVRYYLDNPNEFNIKMGNTYTISSQQVSPQNVATAAMYNYTPHIHGNHNFWRIWMTWFGNKFPDGSLLQSNLDDDAPIYLIQNGEKRQFASKSAFSSRYKATKIQRVDPKEIEQYSDGPEIKFAQFSLLQSPQGTIYLLRGDTIHGLASQEVYRKLGFNPDEIIAVTDEDLAVYAEGIPITLDNTYPTGALLQNKATGGVYYVVDGHKHPIWARELLNTNFSGKRIIGVSAEDLDNFMDGPAVRFNDGELVSAIDDPAVYVISNGKKWPISSGSVFETLGYKWENIIQTSQKILDLHETGEPIILE